MLGWASSQAGRGRHVGGRDRRQPQVGSLRNGKLFKSGGGAFPMVPVTALLDRDLVSGFFVDILLLILFPEGGWFGGWADNGLGVEPRRPQPCCISTHALL